MKKFWKIFLISLASLLALVCIAIGIALWFVFTPARLTPIVNKQAAKFTTCRTEIDRVELTFFSSFPHLGLKADGVRLLNPTDGAPCDTLVRFDRLNAAIDVRAFLKRDELVLSDIVLQNGTVCLFMDSLGRVNYDILNLAPSEEPETEEGGFTITYIDADHLTLKNIDVRYVDQASLMDANIKGLSGIVKGSMKDDAIDADVHIEPCDVMFSMGSADSLMTAAVKGLSLALSGSLNGDKGNAELTLKPSSITFAYAGEEYLTDGVVALGTNADVDLASQTFVIKNGLFSLNGLELALDGSVRNDTLRGLDMNLKYKFGPWDLEPVLALIPASFQSYLDGIDVEGKIASEGTIVGIYGKDSMPMTDLNLVLNEARIAYPSMLPYPLTGVCADLDVHTDLTDAVSYAKVNSLTARTPKSSLRAYGTVDRIFSDPHANITADINGDLADIKPFIPEDIKLTASGKASGRVKADVRMSQIEKMDLEKMKLSGSLLVTGLDARYDTISVASPSVKLDFALPNSKPSTRHTSFVAAALASDRLDVAMSETDKVAVDGMKFAIEASDVLDTLYLPAVACDFSFGSITGRMGDMTLAVANPSGKLSMEPGRRSSTVPRVKMLYDSGKIEAGMEDMEAVVQKLNIDATVMYDESKEDIWQMLMPCGSVSASGTVVNTPQLNYPVELPELAADFTPMQLNIRKAHARLNQSDFSLDGSFDNVLPYFRGDSVLRGEINFNSPVTDVSQLLALTNGIGSDEETPEDAPADEFSGPWMVPEGIDITLHTRIDRALWYGEDLSNIKEFSKIHGDITIRNGVVYMTPELSFSSPVTDGEIMLRYRTPRRNHLYAGILLHLTDINIAEALDLIPDLDTIMPMLRSFEGNAEFHLVAEGNMDSTYRFKLSTLEGMCSISGTDLVLRDEEMFRTVAKFMKYKDEGVLRVDSLSAEFSVSGDVVTVYPFLFSMDRYKAVISGNHNLDMSFNYNISLVQSPIPFRVAVTIKGNPDDMKFKLSKSRYPDFYRPQRSDAVKNRETELRRQIRDALLGTTAAARKKDE